MAKKTTGNGKVPKGLYQIKHSKCWYYYFCLDGTEYRASTGKRDLKEAIAWFEDFKTKLRQGREPEDFIKKWRLSDLVESYFLSVQELRSVLHYRTGLEIVASYFDKDALLRKLEKDSDIIYRFINDRQKKDKIFKKYVIVNGKLKNCEEQLFLPVSRTSVNRNISLIRAMWNFGIQNEMCFKNPIVKGMFSFEAEETAKKTDHLEKDEIKIYLDACSESYYRIAMCALYTGLRQGELLRLTWNDIDINNGELDLGLTKSGKVRMVQVSSKVIDVIKGLRTPEAKGTDRVFYNSKKYPDLNAREGHRKAMLDSGLADKRLRDGKPELRFHDLRHTFATWLAEASKDLTVVQEALGHSDLKITQRYAHMTRDRMKNEVENLANIFDKLDEEVENSETKQITINKQAFPSGIITVNEPLRINVPDKD